MKKEREKRKWWSVVDSDVREVTGYSCAPTNPDLWWCPEVGYTLKEGYSLFDNRHKAFVKAIKSLETDIAKLQGKLDALKDKH